MSRMWVVLSVTGLFYRVTNLSLLRKLLFVTLGVKVIYRRGLKLQLGFDSAIGLQSLHPQLILTSCDLRCFVSLGQVG